MNLITYIIIGTITAFAGAYIMTLQKATLYWGRKLAGHKSDEDFLTESFKETIKNTGFQDAITPSYQGYFVIFYQLVLISYIIYGLIVFSWIHGLVAAIGSFIAKLFFYRFFPNYTSDYWKQKIINSLNARKEKFEQNGDQHRMNAANYFIKLMEKAANS